MIKCTGILIIHSVLTKHRWRKAQEAMQSEAARAMERNRNEDDIKNAVRDETAKLKEVIQEKIDRIKEVENELVLAESQFARAVADSEAAVARATSKDKDMTELMKSINEMQASSKAREEEANESRRTAERKVGELEKSIATTKGELNVFNHERTTLKETLDTAKSERLAALQSLDEMKTKVDDMKTDLNATMSQLTLEKELRSRSEQKEREERNERIALSAQMVAMTKEHAQMETSLNEAKEVEESKWRKQLQAEDEKFKAKEQELIMTGETIAGLRGEIQALKESLQDEKSAAVAENAEHMSKLNAEINVLNEKLRMEEQKNEANGIASQEKVLKLEKQIRDGQAERRRMHNVIQELRGNVRVFARIRPYLPGDNVDDDIEPFAVPKSETSLKLVSGLFSPGSVMIHVYTHLSFISRTSHLIS
jgi:kinesin family protein C1